MMEAEKGEEIGDKWSGTGMVEVGGNGGGLVEPVVVPAVVVVWRWWQWCQL